MSTQVWRLGTVDFVDAWALQRVLHDERVAASIKRQRSGQNVQPPHVLLALEHNPVFTLGRGGTTLGFQSPLDRRVADAAASGEAVALSASGKRAHIFRCDRGGQVTWHGPGQAVLYPIVDLSSPDSACGKDLRAFFHSLESATIATLKTFGLSGGRLEGYPGVWVAGGKRKVGAVGASASRWVTMHGIAINVCCDLDWFDEIIPCGIQGRGVTSICDELNRSESAVECPTVREVHDELIREYKSEFNLLEDGAVVDGPQGWAEAVEAAGGPERVAQAREALLADCCAGQRFDLLRAGTSTAGDLREAKS